MCCRRGQQQSFYLIQPPQRGCCRPRRQDRLLGSAVAATLDNTHPTRTTPQQVSQIYPPAQRHTMAGIIAIGIGLGAEKLSQKISEKRLERKEKKRVAVSTNATIITTTNNLA